MKSFLIVSVCAFLFSNCAKSQGTKEELQLQLLSSFNMVHIYEVPIFLAIDDIIFSSNITDGGICIMDHLGNHIQDIGSSGKGPGEFLSILNMCWSEINKQLIVYDVYSSQISYFDKLYEFLYSEKVYNVFFNIALIEESLVTQYREYTNNNNDIIVHDIIQTKDTSGNIIIIKKKKLKSTDDISYYIDNALIMDANNKDIFILDRSNINFNIEQYNKDNIKTKWELNIHKLKTKKQKKIVSLLVGSDFILLALNDENNIMIYEIYDFDENYIGKIEMSSEDEYIADVFQKKIFVVKTNEDGDYICNIFEVNL